MKIVETSHAVETATTLIADALREAIDARGQATLMLSGGSSPKPVYRRLSGLDIDWSKVRVGLVDERLDPRGSNAELVRRTLLQGAAAEAAFFPMTVESDEAYRELLPADMCVMGMGTDGHTASWFPDSPDLARATDPGTTDTVIRVDATGCGANSGYPARATLTLPAVLASRHILLLIPGAEKREVFVARDGLPVDMLTVSDRLTTILGS